MAGQFSFLGKLLPAVLGPKTSASVNVDSERQEVNSFEKKCSLEACKVVRTAVSADNLLSSTRPGNINAL